MTTTKATATTDTDAPARDWDALAQDARPGDYLRSLGRGFLARRIDSVTIGCNCQQRSRGIDPVTKAPLHYDVVVITAGNFTSYSNVDSTVVLSDGPC